MSEETSTLEHVNTPNASVLFAKVFALQELPLYSARSPPEPVKSMADVKLSI